MNIREHSRCLRPSTPSSSAPSANIQVRTMASTHADPRETLRGRYGLSNAVGFSVGFTLRWSGVWGVLFGCGCTAQLFGRYHANLIVPPSDSVTQVATVLRCRLRHTSHWPQSRSNGPDASQRRSKGVLQCTNVSGLRMGRGGNASCVCMNLQSVSLHSLLFPSGCPICNRQD